MPAKTRRYAAPKAHHLDRRAKALLAVDGPDDELLLPVQVADWLTVSEVWLAQGRHHGFGPKFLKYEDNRVAYTRGAVKAWLKSRTFSSTAEARNA